MSATAAAGVQATLGRATGGVVSLDATSMMISLGPLAARAVNTIRDSLARREAERRSREARDEERRRLRIAITQLFYGSECNRSTPGSVAAVGGPDDPAALERQANEAFGRNDYAGAERLLERAHDQREKQLGPRHADTARTLRKIVACQVALGNMQSAGVYAAADREQLEARLKTTKPAASLQPEEITAALVAADASSALALVSFASGAYLEARRAYERALELRTRSLEADHLCVAESQNALGDLLLMMGDYLTAGALIEKALVTRERTLGPRHLVTAASYHNRASYYRYIGDYDKAESDYKRALDIRKGKLGKTAPEVAESLNDLGDLYKLRGNYIEAEIEYKQALDIREKTPGSELKRAQSLTALGGLYQKIGEYGRAQDAYQAAHVIRQKVLCEGNPLPRGNSLQADRSHKDCDHSDIAESLVALGSIHFALGDYAKAASDYRTALDIRKKTLGADHRLFAESLVALGSVHVAIGDYAKAESEYSAALDIRTKKLGANHADVAQSLYRLAELYQVKGDYRKAKDLCRRALDLRKKTLGENHPDVAESLVQLTTLRAATDQIHDAVTSLRGAFGISEELLRTVGTASGDSRMDALLHTLRAQEEIAYSLACSECATGARPPDTATMAEAVQLAMSIALLRKGRSVDAAASLSRVISQGLDEAGRQQYDDLRALGAQITNLTLGGSDSDDAAGVECVGPAPAPVGPPPARSNRDRTAKLRCLKDKADRLQQQLALRSAQLRARASVTRPGEVVGSVANALAHSDAALVEIVAFQPYIFVAREKQPDRGAPRYLALVLHGDAKARVVNLGSEKVIDDAIDEFRKQVARVPESPQTGNDAESSYETLKSAERLYQLVFQPLHQYVDQDKNIFVSSDGLLQLVPFAALFNGKRYLVDNYEFTYLTSGRDLLRNNDGLQLSTTVEVIANPSFITHVPDEPSPKPVVGRRGLEEESVTLPPTKAPAPQQGAVAVPPQEAGPVTPHETDVDGTIWLSSAIRPLPATAQEAREIRRILRGSKVDVMEGSKATRKAFLDLQSPGILHVATHGYFRQSGKSTGSSVSSRGIEPIDESAGTDDPLQKSMLLMAGAGAYASRPDGRTGLRPEGLVTARDVATMNLWGTQLVVLSACDTGLGDVTNLGQGVYGLRRAVMAGGAETLVTSLWKIDDRTTSELMTRYYQNLFAGQGRVAAMRAAGEWVRKRHKHPYYWAPFIVIGSSDPVVGIGKRNNHP